MKMLTDAFVERSNEWPECDTNSIKYCCFAGTVGCNNHCKLFMKLDFK